MAAEYIITIREGVIKHGERCILSDLNLKIASGELVYLTGKVGSGKSSFLRMLYADLPLAAGEAEVAGFSLKKIRRSQIPMLRRKCGIAFQDFKLLTDRNVEENLRFVLRATGWKKRDVISKRIDEVLSMVGMEEAKSKMVHQLSGGEQKRITIARTLLNMPPLIIADEPTANLDNETTMAIMHIFKDIQSMGQTVIIATHQPDIIEEYPGHILLCANGTITDPREEQEALEPRLDFSEESETSPDAESETAPEPSSDDESPIEAESNAPEPATDEPSPEEPAADEEATKEEK